MYNTDKEIIKGLEVSDYEYNRFKLYNPDQHDKLVQQYRLSRGKVFTISKYTCIIKAGRR